MLPKKILVVYHYRLPEMRLAIESHLRALESSGVKHEITYYNTFDDLPTWSGFIDNSSKYRNTKYDAVILHNTFLCFRWTGSFFPSFKAHFMWLRDMNCMKIAMPQDEYDHAEVLDEWLSDLGVSAVISNFSDAFRRPLYRRLRDKAAFYHGFTGYIDESLAERVRPMLTAPHERKHDVVYRANHLPYWFGWAGQIKVRIADAAAKSAERLGLQYDISTRNEDTILGFKWYEFLASSRGVMGCESGSSVIDRRGEVKERIESLLKEKPGMSYEDVSAQMPLGWDGTPFLAISPRHFESVITKTCQILVEGEYDGVLEPNRHYIPVKRDFSDISEALEKIKDRGYVKKMVDAAYNDVYLSGRHTYKALAEIIERAISGEQPTAAQGVGVRLAVADDEKLLRKIIAERHRKFSVINDMLVWNKSILNDQEVVFRMDNPALATNSAIANLKRALKTSGWFRLIAYATPFVFLAIAAISVYLTIHLAGGS